MAIQNLPQFIRENYQTKEWKHASAILENDFPVEWSDMIEVLNDFRLNKSHIAVGGGRKSKVADSIDYAFTSRGWWKRISIQKLWSIKMS